MSVLVKGHLVTGKKNFKLNKSTYDIYISLNKIVSGKQISREKRNMNRNMIFSEQLQ